MDIDFKDLKKYFGNFLTKPFIVCLVLSVGLLIGLMVFGSMRGNLVVPTDANSTLNDINNARGNATWTGIFLNNIQVSIITLVPVMGLVWQPFVMFNTGYVIGELAKATGMDNFLYVSLLLTDVVGVLEIGAYVLLYAEVLTLTYSAFKKELTERLKKFTWIVLILYVVMLVVAAILETWELGRL